MMNYPDAYCVKCGKHTETLGKKTVVLKNSSRALKGLCPDCDSEVYKILPKDQKYGHDAAKTKASYPNAFCVRCQAHTPTVNAHTVLMENNSRAMTGGCGECGSIVYRILSPGADIKPLNPAANQVVASGSNTRSPLKLVSNRDVPHLSVPPIFVDEKTRQGWSQSPYWAYAAWFFGGASATLLVAVIMMRIFA